MFTIRKTTLPDTPRLLEIFAYARELMKRTGNPTQWKTYPEKDILKADIAAGRSYVLEAEGKIRGTFAYLTEIEPAYAGLEGGSWLNDEPYGTIHRIATDGSMKGILDAALEFAASQRPNIRIDTHEDNRIMLTALAERGFTRCGVVYYDTDVKNHDPRIAFHKVCINYLQNPEKCV